MNKIMYFSFLAAFLFIGFQATFALNVPGCITNYQPASHDCRWKSGLDLDADLTILGARIQSYGIQWFSGRWSHYVKGNEDIDWVKTEEETCNGAQSLAGQERRVWSYFFDHPHYYVICPVS
ncbi:uncharacterized protein LOC110855334 [Folsomia candida]|uniref:Uncharacterized protein n=1 Tax=Folsomia candida TaxID=158441 RepID=A0A226DT48_FOLCA|nr:uncharacterized protein LOC110855334 [Folsomia candida]OXA48198.1 hypothetical protein Fcan01_17018 [Folsomia candida]